MKRRSYIAKNCFSWLKINFGVLLILLALILFISKSLYNIPMGIMAVTGLFWFIKSPRQLWQNPTIRVYVILFLCLWIPMLISLVDAVNPGHSCQTGIAYLRFLFIGIFVILAIGEPKSLNKLNISIFCIMVFWCLDAIIQYLFKVDLFGHPYTAGYITGIFYPEITIGHVTAALSPLYFETVRKHGSKNNWLWILLIPLFIVILLSGRRAAWIMLMVSVFGYLFYLLKLNRFDRSLVNKLCLIGSIIIISMGLVFTSNQSLQNRINGATKIFSGDPEMVDNATGRRISLWATSINIFRDNWINGVGPRGFRYIYQRYSSDDNYWHESGQTHPHQLLFEVLAETGVLGITGFLFFVFLFYRYIKKQGLGIPLFPWWLAILTAIFPFNTHMAFYGSYWSSLFWWLMAVTFASASIQLKKNKEFHIDDTC